jgi:hypothetical protein
MAVLARCWWWLWLLAERSGSTAAGCGARISVVAAYQMVQCRIECLLRARSADWFHVAMWVTVDGQPCRQRPRVDVHLITTGCKLQVQYNRANTIAALLLDNASIAHTLVCRADICAFCAFWLKQMLGNLAQSCDID